MSDLVYNPPGVYVSEDALPVPNLSTLVTLPPSRLAIVGPSVEYQTYTEAVKLTGTTPVTLSQTGISSTSVSVTSLAGVVYEVSSDYTVAQSGSPAEESVTTITRVDLGDITNGAVVYVTYRFTDSDFYFPFVSSDFDEIQSRFGPAINPSTGEVGSPLSLAAKLAMEQGLREVMLVPTKGSSITAVTKAQLAAAYIALEAQNDVGIVVPLPVGITGTDNAPGDTTSVGTDLEVHVNNASNAGQYRIGVYGISKAASRSHDQIAATIANDRVMTVFPNILTYYNGYTNRTMELDGFYLAVGCAAGMAARLPQIPLTRKQVRSFAGIPARVATTMTVSFKNNLGQNGVTVAEVTSQGQLLVRHGLMTDVSSVLTREPSIIRAKDAKIRMIYQALDASGIIGSPITPDTPIQVRSLVEGALAQAVAIGLCVEATNIQVRSSPTDVTTLEVKYAYKPAYPLNFVNVSFSINTLTGTVAET